MTLQHHSPFSDKLAQFRQKMQEKYVLGVFCKTTDSSVIEAIGHSGMDFTVLDMEHSPITTETLKTHLMALQSTPSLGIVRVEHYDSMHIGKALDLGAHGLMVTSVQSAEQAATALRLARFHPHGERGICRFVRAANYGTMAKEDYFMEANRSLMVMQVEGSEALENFDEIIALDDIDVIFVGPYDLSQSLGIPGDIENPRVTKAVDDLITRAARRNVKLGIFTDTMQQLRHWRESGMAFLGYSTEMTVLVQALVDIQENLARK